MCVNVDIHEEKDTLRNLLSIAKARLSPEIKDECSLEILEECKLESYDEVCHSLGRALINSIIVESLKSSINEHNSKDK